MTTQALIFVLGDALILSFYDNTFLVWRLSDLDDKTDFALSA